MSISYSQIATYVDCQVKWDYIYNKGHVLDSVDLRFGSVAHEGLKTRIIPDEMLYSDFKDYYGITSWTKYFTEIFEELDEFLENYEVLGTEVPYQIGELRGIVDIILKNKNTGKIHIYDFKFSNTNRTLTDIELDAQLYIYAGAYALLNRDVSLSNIRVGYITIPKKELASPKMLLNGTLSKAKSQSITYKNYMKAIIDNKLNIDDYLDILEELKD